MPKHAMVRLVALIPTLYNKTKQVGEVFEAKEGYAEYFKKKKMVRLALPGEEVGTFVSPVVSETSRKPVASPRPPAPVEAKPADDSAASGAYPTTGLKPWQMRNTALAAG